MYKVGDVEVFALDVVVVAFAASVAVVCVQNHLERSSGTNHY